MSKSTVEVLREARDLISYPERWTRGVFCDERGRRCATGAVWKATVTNPINHPAMTLLLRVVNTPTVTGFNDSHSHAEVLAAFDRAIELAEAST